MPPYLRPLALGVLLAACAPDRLYVEGTHGWGSIEPGFKDGTYDTESDAVTVGLSFPLGEPESYVRRSSPLPRPPAAAALTGAPIVPRGTLPDDDGQDVPWESLLLLLGGAAGWEGGKRGYGKYQKRSGKKASQCA